MCHTDFTYVVLRSNAQVSTKFNQLYSTALIRDRYKGLKSGVKQIYFAFVLLIHIVNVIFKIY
jgi:hypothetical protein